MAPAASVLVGIAGGTSIAIGQGRPGMSGLGQVPTFHQRRDPTRGDWELLSFLPALILSGRPDTPSRFHLHWYSPRWVKCYLTFNGGHMVSCPPASLT